MQSWYITAVVVS